MKKAITFIMTGIVMMNFLNTKAQCVDDSNIYSFVYNDNTYEIVKENKTWEEAAACAVERGGYLVEINDGSEQNAIFNELMSNANIEVDNTVAPDGGGGSYVWLGGNDLAEEGTWIWDGDNDGNGTQFWQGAADGAPVGGLYNNWGNEPDDWNGQDALGLSLNGWPLGVAGEWNDVDETNSLYFVIEYTGIVGLEDNKFKNIFLYPNPVKDYLFIESGNNIDLNEVNILNTLGQNINTIEFDGTSSIKIDLSGLNTGAYFIKLHTTGGETLIRKILK